jgi:SAM-dependent methyltransferase
MDLAWVRFPPREQWGQRRFVAGNGVSLPFADGAFDKVLMLEVIEHFPSDAVGGLLGEIRRVLRPGGGLVLSTPRRRALTNPLRYPFQWLTRIPGVIRQEWREFCEAHRSRMAQLEKESGVAEHERLYTARELRTLLSVHGFEVQAMKGGTISPYMTGFLHAESVSGPLHALWRLLNLTSVWPACTWDVIVRADRSQDS